MFKMLLLAILFLTSAAFQFLTTKKDVRRKVEEAYRLCNFNRDSWLSAGEEYMCFQGQYFPPVDMQQKFGPDATQQDVEAIFQ
jgi:hypothetical protein